jgi:lysophospholipase L1-like esterase
MISMIFGLLFLELIHSAWNVGDPWSRTAALNIVRDRRIEYEALSRDGEILFKTVYTRDSFGLRGSCTNTGEIAILTIGGSTTDQKYVSDEDTFQDVLKKELEKISGKKTCIANAGVDGHSTFGHIAAFDGWLPLIPNLEPSHILFYVGINDAGFRDKPNFGFDTFELENESSIWALVRKRSATYSALRVMRNIWVGTDRKRLYAAHSDSIPQHIEYTEFNETDNVQNLINDNTGAFRHRFEILLQRVKRYRAKPICVSQPHLFTRPIGNQKGGVANVFSYKNKVYNGLDYDASIRSINNAMKVLCLKYDGYFIDIADKDFEISDFYDSIHMNNAGAKKLGNYIYQEIINQNIILELKFH